ncbi:hypothetical protein ARMGADRAFT_1084537 [Armillaria gallica]|uniref:Uncharacterized protein n=1 Tax=Armillaria gallica TaxID=47427 RepID=A0A2H3D3A8_ARMGA|nr:hypothetical protein ARMGADRAFT_1084537 [Armillaria gallica]
MKHVESDAHVDGGVRMHHASVVVAVQERHRHVADSLQPRSFGPFDALILPQTLTAIFTEPKTLSETRTKRLASYHRDAVPIDEETRTHHDSLIGPVHLLNVGLNRDYLPFVQFIRRILVHLTVSSRSGWGTIGSYECTLMFMRRTAMGKDVWDDLYPNSGIDLLPFILSYIQDSPPAIVLEERSPPKSFWGSWRDNEIVISCELVAAYLDLETRPSPLYCV